MKLIFLYVMFFIIVHTAIKTLIYLYNYYIKHKNSVDYLKNEDPYSFKIVEKRIFLVLEKNGSLRLVEKLVWGNKQDKKFKKIRKELKPKTPD